MKRTFLAIILAATFLPGVAAAADSTFVNNSTFEFVNNGVTNTPAIDAVTFINNGTFVATTAGVLPGLGQPLPSFISPPFETINTLNYTNNGEMRGNTGFRFALTPANTGSRRSAANFFNGNNASIFGQNFIWVFATNIVNSGGFVAGGNGLGEIRLEGSDVNLAESLTSFPPFSMFDPLDWDSTNVTVLPQSVWMQRGSILEISTNIIRQGTVVGPFELPPFTFTTNITTNITGGDIVATAQAGTVSAFVGPSSLGAWQNSGFNSPVADSFNGNFDFTTVVLTNYTIIGVTNITTNFIVVPNVITNLTRQAIFVRHPSFLRLRTGFESEGGGATAGALLSMLATNPVTEEVTEQYILLLDNMAAIRGTGLIVNTNEGTAVPTNYVVVQSPEIFAAFTPGRGPPPLNFFYTSGNREIQVTNTRLQAELDFDFITNAVVTNGLFSSFSFFIDNLAYRPPPVFGGTVTNLPDRIIVSARNLDLTRTRMAADGLISIQAENLTSTEDTMLDSENMLLDIGSRTRDLKVESLMREFTLTRRLRGTVRMETDFWTNDIQLVFSNNQAITVSGEVPTVSNDPVYLNITVPCQAFFVDASAVEEPNFPVNVYDLQMHGTHIEFNDSATVLKSFLVDGSSLTLNGQIFLRGSMPSLNPREGSPNPDAPIVNWIFTNAPALVHFTNNGFLSVPNDAHFGDDRGVPYSEFVNAGFISSASMKVDARLFENRGGLFPGSLFVESGSSVFNNSFTYASGRVELFTDSLVLFNNNEITTGDTINFAVTNLLTDNRRFNYFVSGNGFSLLAKPRFGDLLGSTFVSVVTNITPKTAFHRWSAEDRGASGAGYTNNAAIDVLSLVSLNAGSRFRFSGTAPPGVTNGLYVDQLDMSNFGQDLGQSRLIIDPNIVIYYADVEMPEGFFVLPAGTNGMPMTAEEYLESEVSPFRGRLRWVRTFAGPNSTTRVDHTNDLGQLIRVRVNNALRNSDNADSDFDGIPNRSDSTPFIFAPLGVQVSGRGTVGPNGDGQLLIVGETYTLVATPADGSEFFGWIVSGLPEDVDTSSPLLTFVMPAGGVNVTAEFGQATQAGRYSGVFYQTDTNGIQFERSGFVTLNRTRNDRYSGVVTAGGQRYGFNGSIESDGFSIAFAGPYELQLQFGPEQITGVVTNDEFGAALLAHRNPFNGRSRVAPYAGKYTVLLPGSADPADTIVPQGDGYGTLTVTRAGQVRLAGELADGARIAQTTTISEDGLIPIYVPLYRGGGQILGWLGIDGDYVDGWYHWIKLPNENATMYPDGFMFGSTNIVGMKLNSALKPVTGFGNAKVELSHGDLLSAITRNVSIRPNNLAVSPAGSRLALRFNPSLGVFTGTVLDPATRRNVRFSGVILQQQGAGYGHFRGRTLSGPAVLMP